MCIIDDIQKDISRWQIYDDSIITVTCYCTQRNSTDLSLCKNCRYNEIQLNRKSFNPYGFISIKIDMTLSTFKKITFIHPFIGEGYTSLDDSFSISGRHYAIGRDTITNYENLISFLKKDFAHKLTEDYTEKFSIYFEELSKLECIRKLFGDTEIEYVIEI